MLPALLSLPGKLSTLLTRLSDARATKLDNLDATISSRSTLTQAQAASGVWANATRSLTTQVCIKSVHRGTIQVVYPNLTASVAISPAVDDKKTFIVCSASGPWEADNVSRLRLALATNGLSIVATRSATTMGGELYPPSGIYSFEVVEFY